MGYYVNSTHAYHISELNSLGWELTVSNCLYPDRSPCRSILKKPTSYGCLLYDFLNANIPLSQVHSILEIGGGYGYLMQDILKQNDSFQVTMADISPFLLGEQKKLLADFPVNYLLADAINMTDAAIRAYDLVILNENVGDFPTVVNIPTEILAEHNEKEQDPCLTKIRSLFLSYDFPSPDRDTFNFNLGAVEVTEKICLAQVPFIFISEHSCEAAVPGEYRQIISVSAPGNPEQISLKGHDEYTIKFSHLEIVAGHLGYRVQRGPLADFVRLDFNDSLMWLLKRRHLNKDKHEILRHFVEDLYQYEYLLLVKQDD